MEAVKCISTKPMDFSSSTVADPRGAGGPGPAIPVKTSHKKDGHRAGSQVSGVIGPPDKFLDPLLRHPIYADTQSLVIARDDYEHDQIKDTSITHWQHSNYTNNKAFQKKLVFEGYEYIYNPQAERSLDVQQRKFNPKIDLYYYLPDYGSQALSFELDFRVPVL